MIATTDVPADAPAMPPRTPTPHKAGNVAPLRKRYYLTELGNAERFIDQHHDTVIYCPAYGWLVYRAGKWCRDCEHLVRARIQKTIRGMQREAGQLEIAASKIADAEKRKEMETEAETLRKWAKRSETEHMVKAMLDLAEPNLTVDAEIFDRDLWLLNVKNGTLDLRTGELRPHRHEDYLMKQCGVTYDPNAEAPTVIAWLAQIMCGDEELVTYLQQVLGYSLTGDTAEQKWFLLRGGGQNGKSTLMHLLHHVLRDYAVEINPDTVTAASFTRGGAEPAPDVVRLAGARVVVASETEQGARLKSALMKRLTGCDPITARDLYHSPFEFTPQCKLFLDTNHLPQVRDRSFAFWRRVRLVPFNYTIPTAARDATIEDRLKAEGAGLLTWLVQGLRAYLGAGQRLPACKAVDTATDQYQSDQDIIATFLRERCIIEHGAEQPAQELYDTFKGWIDDQMGERAMAQRSFTQALTELGYTSHRVAKGMLWCGLRLRTEYDPVPLTPAEETASESESHQAEETATSETPAEELLATSHTEIRLAPTPTLTPAAAARSSSGSSAALPSARSAPRPGAISDDWLDGGVI